jgi:hypothetical protein
MAPPNSSELNLLAILSTQAQPLFALLDAAKDSQILELLPLLLKPADYQSLYEGKPAEQLAGFAPYLVSLSANAAFLETLVETGWGESWGIYFTSEYPFATVRQHLRQFLLVKNQAGKPLYFRFYDPRVLRKFLPTCTPAQLKEFFGPIRRFLLEGINKNQVLQFQCQPIGLQCETRTINM